MEIKSPLRGKVVIEGTIRGMADVAEIKTVISGFQLEEGDLLEVEITDSFSMPSALIGFLLKVAEQQGCRVNVTVGNEVLAELLEDLGLKSIFHLRLREYARP